MIKSHVASAPVIIYFPNEPLQGSAPTMGIAPLPTWSPCPRIHIAAPQLNSLHLPAPRATPDGTFAIALDGVFASHSRLYTNARDLTDHSISESDLTSMRGAFALYAVNPAERKAFVYPDLFSQAIIYYYTSDTISAYSSSLRSLAATLALLGVTLSKSTVFFSELLGSDAGGFSDSPFREIRTVPFGSYVEISSEHAPRIRSYTSLASLLADDRPYESRLADAASEILDNARAAHEYDAQTVVHLTAGADSRLAAGALAQIAAPDDSMRTYTAIDSVKHEEQIADAVATYLGFQSTRTPPMRPYAVHMDQRDEQVQILSFMEGMKATGCPSPFTISSDTLVIAGYFGEFYRSFYGRRVKSFDPNDLLQQTFPRHVASPEEGILARTTREELSEHISSRIDSVRQQFPVDTSAVWDAIYMSVRQRYFGSHILMENSRFAPHFSPLYSPIGFALALSLPLDERAGGRLVSDLFQRVCPRALDIAFDKPKFDDAYTKPHFGRLETSSLSVRTPIPRDSFTALKIARSSADPIPEVTYEIVDRARRMGGVKAQQLAREYYSRKFIRQGLGQPASHQLWYKAFDVPRLKELISRPASNKSRVLAVSRLALFGTWYH